MLKHGEISQTILGAFYFVYNQLGYGFLERVYHNALIHELRKRGLEVQSEVQVRVYFDGVVVGEYCADLIVNGLVLVEVKACYAIAHEHELQVLHYLRATDLEVALILNFGPQPKAIRKVYDNELKRLR